MDQTSALKRLAPPALPQASAAQSPGHAMKVAMGAVLVAGFVCVAMASEVRLLQSGVEVVVMPE
jgi:hypothetical protein